MNSIKAMFGHLMVLTALTTLLAVNAVASGVFCVLLEDTRMMNNVGNSHYMEVEELIPDLLDGPGRAALEAVGQHLDDIGQNATATELNAAEINEAAIQTGIDSLMILTAELVGLTIAYSNNAADLAAAFASGDYPLMSELVDDGQMLIAAMQAKGNDIRKEIQMAQN